MTHVQATKSLCHSGAIPELRHLRSCSLLRGHLAISEAAPRSKDTWSFQKPLLAPRTLSHSRSRNSLQGHFHPEDSNAPSHSGVHPFSETSAPRKITLATDHLRYPPSVTSWQQIIFNPRLQLHSLTSSHVHNVKRPPAWTVMDWGGIFCMRSQQ